MSYRIETDLLGDMHLPDDAYYGIQTARALENFPITNQSVNKKLINELVLIKKSFCFNPFKA